MQLDIATLPAHETLAIGAIFSCITYKIYCSNVSFIIFLHSSPLLFVPFPSKPFYPFLSNLFHLKNLFLFSSFHLTLLGLPH
jgi:hypothetical protein